MVRRRAWSEPEESMSGPQESMARTRRRAGVDCNNRAGLDATEYFPASFAPRASMGQGVALAVSCYLCLRKLFVLVNFSVILVPSVGAL